MISKFSPEPASPLFDNDKHTEGSAPSVETGPDVYLFLFCLLLVLLFWFSLGKRYVSASLS